MTAAFVATTSTAAVPARAMIPFEKTSRWPRLVSCRGRKLSPAWKLARRGKSAKPVLAASTRMSIVAAWSERLRSLPAVPVPYTASPTWASTVGVPSSNGRTFTLLARAESPRNITPSPAPMITSVCRAFFHAGSRKAGTPFEIASTPVTAEPPEAKALASTYAVAP